MYVTHETFEAEYDKAIRLNPRGIKLAVDFETNSNVPLRKTGIGPYFGDPEFQTLMCGVAFRTPGGPIYSTTYTCFDTLPSTTLPLAVEMVAMHASVAPTYAHNSAFEMNVMRLFGHASRIRDTAVLARIQGANAHLKWAGPQLVSSDKLVSGEKFIQTFCMGDPREVTQAYVDSTPERSRLWLDGLEYCANDAEVCLQIAEIWDDLPVREWRYFFLTQDMNDVGWKVDTDLVERMALQAQANATLIEREWRESFDPRDPKDGKPLNLGSWQQVQRYIKARGFTITSTDKVVMAKLLKRIQSRRTLTQNDRDVEGLILTKQALGGSSLSKLSTIQDMVCDDDRLRYQYSHIGAGQTWRTSGTGVQMQNLKRLGNTVSNVDQPLTAFSNTELADNLRQVFTARTADHVLMVSDLSSIEARVLAWLAWEEWKLDAINRGEDLYKLLAMDIFKLSYAQIQKPQRNQGKVGELGGGYGMGGQALKDFADKMGIEITLDESYSIITAYREKNLRIKALWFALNEAMIKALKGISNDCRVHVGPPQLAYTVRFEAESEQQELECVMTGTQRLTMSLWNEGDLIFERVWRGAYITQGMFGDEVIYHRSPKTPSHNRLWVDHSVGEDTDEKYMNKLYGGKLTGVLVQSFARELFFSMVYEIANMLPATCLLLGQFHDEVVIDVPVEIAGLVGDLVHDVMSKSPYPELPVDCEVKQAYRYIK